MIYKFNKEKHRYDKITWGIISMLVCLILIFSGITYLMTYKHINDVRYISQETKSIILKDNYDFSKAKLKEYILDLNIRFPHIVMAQAEVETGGFTSPIFRENNNLFGLKVAKGRPTTNKGENRGHAFYNNWRESVQDYALYVSAYLNNIRDEKDYFNYLKQNYAEDTTYVTKLKQIIKNINTIN